MGIIDDIKRDKRTQNVLTQTNTKTVSAPPASTGLVGDQAPAEIFSATDFDVVKNQVHLEEENFQLMEALNTMGRLTNMQSQSGPIPGTLAVSSVTSTTAQQVVTFRPDSGQVWQLVGASAGLKYTGQTNVIMQLTDGSTSVEISDTTSQGEPFFENSFFTPLYISYEAYLAFQFVGSSTGGTGDCRIAVVRVR